MVFDPAKFTTVDPRFLPVVLLLDSSGTMGQVTNPDEVTSTGQTFFDDGVEWEIVEGGISRMQILNQSISKMLQSFVNLEKMEFGIKVCIIRFGDQAEVYQSLRLASDIEYRPLDFGGDTAMGGALRLAQGFIDDRKLITSRSYRPVVVLVSDGQPTDDWQGALQEFNNGQRTSKCQKMALAIGAEVNLNALQDFVGDQGDVFNASNAHEIPEFFRRVTMSVTSRTLSQNPNQF